jgi:protein-disulfide isomerase
MKLVTVSLISALFLSSPVLAQETTTQPAPSFNPTQQKAIEKIVHDYLVSQPEVLMEVAKSLQQKEQEKLKEKATKAINDKTTQIFADPNSPVVGDPKSNIAVVEFFDYQCGHCKHMVEPLYNIIKSDPNIKIIFKNFPIFGENSIYAAKAGLASQKQGKFLAFHNALLSSQKPLTPEVVLDIAKQTGLDTNQLKKDMEDPSLDQEIKNNLQLAQDLMLRGTPAFIFAKLDVDKTNKLNIVKEPLLVPGAVNEEGLKQSIQMIETSKP